jgi:DNA-binding winged helix-turn-helix (wHTH) protein/tetratricopeptide (TPR) repeat protein
MQEPRCLVFGPFRLDLCDERLWRGDEATPLSPKTFAVLRCLVTQAGQLVTKDALLEAVWPDTAVSESILTVAIRTLRRVLGDKARTPCFIETVHGRGYRFIAPVSAAMPYVQHPVSHPPLFVGRDAELAQLVQWWTTARQGQRHVGCIVGEPGIGKTALVETFVAQIRATEDAWIGHGQCLDHYGAGEAYLPVLEALGRLGRGPEGALLVTVLRQHAPSWLAHLPALLTPEDQERLAHATSGVTPARMLRELAEALEVLTAARPLVLVLEDLHWSDRATLEWLAYVVRRRDPARLLLLGTYRDVDVMVHAPALRAMVADLRHHPQYAELALDSLSAAATAAYLRQRCGEQSIPPALLQLVHQRTGGHPLFLVAMVDELRRQGLLETAGDARASQGALAVLSELVPTSLRQYIEQHLEQLSDEDQALLEAASVAGSTFAVAAVAAGVGQAPEPLEARYAALSRQERFIRSADVELWPDGTVTACYQFRHALYHEVVYARVSAGSRVRLHQQIGARKEAGYGVQARQIATELAAHFARGRDAWRAITYLQCAGENALQRSAYQEAVTHLTMALENLVTLPETRERSQQELVVQMALGQALSATKGQASPEVERVYIRARALCEQVGEPQQLFLVLGGLLRVYNTRGAGQTARALGEQLLSLAQRLHDPDLLLEAHHILGLNLFHGGALAAARPHLEQGLQLCEPQRHRVHVAFYSGHDPGVCCHMHTAMVLWLLGRPDQAVASSQAALTLAQQLAHPLSLTLGPYDY